MRRETRVELSGGLSRVFPALSTFSIALIVCLCVSNAAAQGTLHQGRGAVSAQDQAKLTAQASASSATADSICPRFPVGSVVSAPPELQSQNGVLEFTMQFLTVVDAQGLTRYCYVTSTGLEAPTLRVNPGDQLIIHFQNMLPAAASSSTSDNMAGMKMTLASDQATTSRSSACNGAMSASATNIHFHGTNVGPVCGQDEVIHTLVQPGQNFDYNVQIPANEPPGLYWYHPHPHGFSEGQVQGGATGALIVEGLQNVDPSLAGLTERTFVIRDQLLPNSELNDSNIPAWDLSINYVPVTYPSYTPAIIQTNPEQQELWRVANTAADTILNLQYIVDGTSQTVQVVAIDGYPIASAGSGQTSVSETSIQLSPGARAEFLITTPNVGDKAQLVTQYWNTGPDGDFDPARPIANIVSQSGGESVRNAHTRLLPSRPAPAKVSRYADLASATPVAQRNLYFSEVLLDPTNPLSPTTFFITEQGHSPAVFTMDQAPNIIVHSGTVEDWVVENRAQEDHIFHIHQIHFQVLEVDGQAVNDPAIRDTVDLPYWNGSGPYPSVKVRMDFRDPNIVGTFVYHCHILEHEDGGMMGEIQVLPSAGSASVTTVAASASSIAPNGNITLTATVLDAASGSSSPTGTVEFQLNGQTIGPPAALVSGQASLSTTLNGNVGTNNLTAFYQGDSTYAESVSAPVPISISTFALSSSGTRAALGSAALANIAINVANNFTTPIALTCALPPGLTESACFVNPNSMTGTGNFSLTVNTTPAHPMSSRLRGTPLWFAGGCGSANLACVLLVAFPRRRGRFRAMLALAFAAVLVIVIGCGSSAKTDPGTAQGTYNMLVTGTAGSGSAQYQASVSVPITIQ
jgi:FtsP/CotA-like multicopper oxidase with cupredoxin domain